MERRLAAAAVARELSRGTLLALGMCAALVIGAPHATAQSSAIARAASAFQRGLDLYQAHDYVGAADEFQGSYELDPRPEALFAWAQAARLSNDCTTAVELYSEFLDGEPRAEDAEAARAARAICLQRIAAAVARTDVAEPHDPAPLIDDFSEPERDDHLEDESVEVAPLPRAARGERPRRARASSTVHRATRPAAVSPHRLLAYARVDIDARGRGAVVAPGIDLMLASGWEVFASALIGGNRGAEIGARYASSAGRLRPFATAALPVFMIDGYHPGVRAGVGVRAPFGRDLSVTLELGGAQALSAPDGAATTVGLISVGLELAM